MAGFHSVFADEWYVITQAEAVILSRSFFAETAAEVGRRENVYFVTGCVKTYGSQFELK